MSAYRKVKLKWNVMAYGGGILFGVAAMAWVTVWLAFAAVVR